jgi:hypothetical protein
MQPCKSQDAARMQTQQAHHVMTQHSGNVRFAKHIMRSYQRILHRAATANVCMHWVRAVLSRMYC